MRTAITAASCITPLECIDNPLLLVEGGVITFVGGRRERELPDHTQVAAFPGAVLAPGLIDLHIHGGAGFDVMSSDRAGLAAFELHLVRHGVTSYVPTTVTAAIDDSLAALDRLADAIERSPGRPRGELFAQPVGIHLEGPFISHAKRGVHPALQIQPPSIELFERFWQAARGHIRIMTIAPEIPGACDLIADAVRRGVRVSLGHSDAGFDDARAGIAAGARHATHTFNAMRRMDHRDPGIVAAVLNDDSVTAEIIADGIHVAPAMIDLFLRAKGRDRALLVSDAISATGMGDGRFQIGPIGVEVENGVCRVEGKLAGSVLTLDRAVRNIMAFADWELADAVRLATLNPARQLGKGFGEGMLVPGAPANLVVLSSAGEVIQTMVRGHGVLPV